jgi:hypothetical protein
MAKTKKKQATKRTSTTPHYDHLARVKEWSSGGLAGSARRELRGQLRHDPIATARWGRKAGNRVRMRRLMLDMSQTDLAR